MVLQLGNQQEADWLRVQKTRLPRSTQRRYLDCLGRGSLVGHYLLVSKLISVGRAVERINNPVSRLATDVE
jgi:hypothetical protein